jgi:hypothetical protein
MSPAAMSSALDFGTEFTSSRTVHGTTFVVGGPIEPVAANRMLIRPDGFVV